MGGLAHQKQRLTCAAYLTCSKAWSIHELQNSYPLKLYPQQSLAQVMKFGSCRPFLHAGLGRCRFNEIWVCPMQALSCIKSKKKSGSAAKPLLDFLGKHISCIYKSEIHGKALR